MLKIKKNSTEKTSKRTNRQQDEQTSRRRLFHRTFILWVRKGTCAVWLVIRTIRWPLGYFFHTCLTVFNQKSNFSFSLLDVHLHANNQNDPFIPSGVYLYLIKESGCLKVIQWKKRWKPICLFSTWLNPNDYYGSYCDSGQLLNLVVYNNTQ